MPRPYRGPLVIRAALIEALTPMMEVEKFKREEALRDLQVCLEKRMSKGAISNARMRAHDATGCLRGLRTVILKLQTDLEQDVRADLLEHS